MLGNNGVYDTIQGKGSAAGKFRGKIRASLGSAVRN